MENPVPTIRIEEREPGAVPMCIWLEADPSEGHVGSYLSGSRCFVALLENAPVGACALLPTSQGVLEVMNIAVLPEFQRKGVGSALLRHVIAHAREAGMCRMELGTGTFGHQLTWYQRAGFRVFAVDRDHFVREYEEPIIEAGLRHKDMLRLALDL